MQSSISPYSLRWFFALPGLVRGRKSEFRNAAINSPRARWPVPLALRRTIEWDRARPPSPDVSRTARSDDVPALLALSPRGG